MPPLDEFAVPLELAGIKTVPQNRMHCTDRDVGASPPIEKTCVTRLLCDLFQRILARGVPLQQLVDDGRNLRIGGNDLLAVRAGNVAIA